MRRHAKPLAAVDVAYCGPARGARAATEGRVALQVGAARSRGISTLVLSDEAMIGTVAENIAAAALYPQISAHIAAAVSALDEQIAGVLFCPRSLDYYWGSALADAVAQGHEVPDRAVLKAIAASERSWRDVITDLAQALPGVPIRVLPFEAFAGRPEAFLQAGTGVSAPLDRDRRWLNRAPNLPELRRGLAHRSADGSALPFGMGRWNPFTPEETAALRERYADDMMWLVAGADGLATLTEDGAPIRAGQTLPTGAQTKGHGDEHEERQMARPG
ncbi:hypothetical protein So717_02080 [Roseobacter cerasinus]|uniref:Uncharacterized protein n=2 Tax=Roseobacter cerasinus TaxID=2602289 RepID=A0A640VNM2_9RHOB|nr:hypothetical protein So717_02080 [Roseobacter cerasinus]